MPKDAPLPLFPMPKVSHTMKLWCLPLQRLVMRWGGKSNYFVSTCRFATNSNLWNMRPHVPEIRGATLISIKPSILGLLLETLYSRLQTNVISLYVISLLLFYFSYPFQFYTFFSISGNVICFSYSPQCYPPNLLDAIMHLLSVGTSNVVYYYIDISNY